MKRLWVISMGLVCLMGLCGCGPGATEPSAASREERFRLVQVEDLG